MAVISRIALVGALVLVAGVTVAENFTTAAEVKPILTATKAAWIAVRPYDGHDLLYFTNALAWRCGVAEIRYGVNGAKAETVLAMEPCHGDEAVPNALKLAGVLPYVTLPLNSVQSVSVVVVFDDGSAEPAEYLRAAVLMP